MADLAGNVGWILGALGIIGAVIAAVSNFRKTGSEKTGLLVDAATDVVVIQKNAIIDLTERLTRAETTIDSLRFIQSEIEHLRLELQKVHSENEKLKAENTRLRKRIKALEDNGL